MSNYGSHADFYKAVKSIAEQGTVILKDYFDSETEVAYHSLDMHIKSVVDVVTKFCDTDMNWLNYFIELFSGNKDRQMLHIHLSAAMKKKKDSYLKDSKIFLDLEELNASTLLLDAEVENFLHPDVNISTVELLKRYSALNEKVSYLFLPICCKYIV
jgi:hypothetical protein